MKLNTTWHKKPLVSTNGDTARVSVVFTWHLPEAKEICRNYKRQGYRVIVGGPAIDLVPGYIWMADQRGGSWDGALQRFNPQATKTSTGCIRRCQFCAVWRTEGDLVELDNWPVLPIVCDNNLLACSVAHFDRVVDRLKPLQGIDFNQGLDARLLTKHHTDRLAELDCRVRLAFDHIAYESDFMVAFRTLRRAGIPKKAIQVYVLIGHKDTPEDALYRLRAVQALGIRPNPMRFQPLDALKKNSFVGDSWTDTELRRYTRYWSRLRYFEHIPFEDFDNSYRSTKLDKDRAGVV